MSITAFKLEQPICLSTRMGKAIVAQAYKGILHNNENKQATGTSNNMDASHRYMIK